MKFFVGLHQPSDAVHFAASFISVLRLRRRRSDFPVHTWIMDSGAFSQIASGAGDFDMGVGEYAEHIARWRKCGTMVRAVAQDYMCEPFVLTRTGHTVDEHQHMTIERYVDLASLVDGVMPVLQGYQPGDYAQHVRDYGSLLTHGMWVGVGSVCKRNSNPSSILAVLDAIKRVRPDLRLHGFGLKVSALQWAAVRDRLFSADSMAWSYSARKQGRNGNDWREAKAFETRIRRQGLQTDLWDMGVGDGIVRTGDCTTFGAAWG